MRGCIREWILETDHCTPKRKVLPLDYKPNCFDIVKDGGFVIGDDEGFEVRGFQGEPKRAQTDKPIKQLAYSSARGLVVTASRNKAEIWDISDNLQTPYQKFQSQADTIRSVAISEDGYRVLTCGEDFLAKLWEVKSDELRSPLMTLAPHTDIVTTVLFADINQKATVVTADLAGRIFIEEASKPTFEANDEDSDESMNDEDEYRFFLTEPKEIPEQEIPEPLVAFHEGGTEGFCLSVNNKTGEESTGKCEVWIREKSEPQWKKTYEFFTEPQNEGHDGNPSKITNIAFSPEKKLGLFCNSGGKFKLVDFGKNVNNQVKDLDWKNAKVHASAKDGEQSREESNPSDRQVTGQDDSKSEITASLFHCDEHDMFFLYIANKRGDIGKYSYTRNDENGESDVKLVSEVRVYGHVRNMKYNEEEEKIDIVYSNSQP